MQRKMRILIIYMMSLLLAGCVQQGGGSPSDDRPVLADSVNSVLYAPVKRLNLGTVTTDGSATRRFGFMSYNRSDKAVSINRADVSCGCVVVEQYPDIIFAGDSAELSGTIDLTNQHGHVSKAIYVWCNRSDVLLLRVMCDIKD